MSKIRCYLNTPNSEFASEEGDMIVLPGEQGELGVQFNHMPMIVELKQGKVRIYAGYAIIQEIEVRGGIAYIKHDSVEILSS